MGILGFGRVTKLEDLKVNDLNTGIYNLCNKNYNTVINTANDIAKYFNVETKLLVNKNEGETLPLMDNSKITNALDNNYFSKHEIALVKYLKDLENN